jgi:uncharacterized hydrophobic protein (TIGR00271 family)
MAAKKEIEKVEEEAKAAVTEIKKTEKDETDTFESVKQWNFVTHLFKRVTGNEYDLLKGGIDGLKEEYELYRERKRETLEKFLAYETVIENSTDTIEYYVLLVLSCVIATLGLLLNSAAVIIGAMIVAPLIAPILGFSAGIMWGSSHDVFEAFTTLVKGVLLVLAITSLTALLFPYVELNSEILSRTSPGLLDIGIALASGFVGSYAYVNNKVSSSIPGVAISVALMPPLCTAGIGLGIFNLQVAFGGLLLFLVNLIGISLAAVIVFYLVRLNPHTYTEEGNEILKKRFTSQLVLTAALLLILALPLGYFTIRAYGISSGKSKIQELIYSTTGKSNVYDLDIQHDGNAYDIKLVLYNGVDSQTVRNSMKRLTNIKTRFSIYTLTKAREMKDNGHQ